MERIDYIKYSRSKALEYQTRTSIGLKNGKYRVAASVSASNVSNYAGNENLQGGNYSVDYYISTYRY